MRLHHEVWLSAHPNRSEAWLQERLRDGFDVHHLDGDRDNNVAANLVLIEHSDHMMIHKGGVRMLGRLDRKKAMRRRARYAMTPDGKKLRLFKRERAEKILQGYEQDPGAFQWRVIADKK